MRKTIALATTGLATIGLALTPAAAFAGTASGNMTVIATVLASATVTATAPVFANYDPTSGTATTDTLNGTVVVVATSGTPYTLSLSSANASGAQFQMKDLTGNALQYNLYSDLARSALFDATHTVAKTGSALPQTTNVYGKIPAGQTAPAGAYTDTVTVTATF